MKINIRNLALFETRLESLNRRARRLKLPAITFTVLQSFPQTVAVYEIDESDRRKVGEETIVTHDIEVQGGDTPIAVSGWEFMARLTPLPGGSGNFIAARAGAATLPEQYRTCYIECDHCNTNRRRKDSFILKNEAGALKQVGRNCLADFLGGTSGDSLAKQFEFLGELNTLLSEYERHEGGAWCGGGEPVFDLVKVLAAALTVHEGKYISRKAEREDYTRQTISTAEATLQFMRKHKATGEGAEDAAEAIIADTLTAMLDDGDYAHNCLLLARAGFCTRKSFGVAVSLISGYNRRRADAVRQEANAASEYVGTIGERRNWTARMERFFDVSGMYGLTRICLLRTPEGAVIKANNIDAEPGDTVKFKATVKAHSDYKGIKQTVLSRPASVVVLENATAAA